MDITVRYYCGGAFRKVTGTENEDLALRVTVDAERTRVVLHPKRELRLAGASIDAPFHLEKGSRVFLNGYQSWTDTREFGAEDRLHDMRLVPEALKERFHFESYGDPWFYAYDRDVLHGYTYSYVRKPNGQTALTGSLNEENAWLIIRFDRRQNVVMLQSDCEHKVTDREFVLFDFVHYEGRTQEVLRRYFANFGPCDAPPLRGYTSWYLHYQDISERKMRRALSGIGSGEFDLFQIDDGYETYVGDWMEIDPEKFPHGLAPVVKLIRGKGLRAGIWLAPFVCETESRVYREHPDWVLRKDGKEVFAGSNWSGDVALDIRMPEVRDYVRTCLEFYMDLGFDFFKLDFLYAAALAADCGSVQTRAELMRGAMQFLRDVLKDRRILGCGVPLSSAFGLVDYCRIGPDVSLQFDDVPYMRMMHRERISTKNTILNMIYRSAMDGRVFRCDPDVFLLRDDNIRLSREQRRALIMIGHLCGSVYMTSDNVSAYDAEKRAVLEEARRLAGAEITGTHQNGPVVSIKYRLDGKTGLLRYNMKKGILV